MFVVLAASAGKAATAQLVSITTPRGVRQAFILIEPDKPVASVVLFAGGSGALGLSGASAMKWNAQNFLVRSREKFAGRGFDVAVVDAPSDHPRGMSAGFRMSRAHKGDIAAVVAYLKQRAAVPVWLVGTSMGTFSAAAGAIAVHNVAGLVLTSTITGVESKWKIAGTHPDGVASMALERITVPTLIVAHRDDGCPLSPASGAAKLRARLGAARVVKVAVIEGGLTPASDPCDAKARHGYYGVEDKAIDAIAAFIQANGR